MIAQVRRLAAMSSQELRFRAVCEARKSVGRVAAGLRAPSWDRHDLLRRLNEGTPDSPSWLAAIDALRRGDARGAHAAMAAHFAARSSPFPVNAHGVRALARAIDGAFPGAAPEAAARGDEILAGTYRLLGYTGLQLGSPPDWHADPVHGGRAPLVFWSAVPYLDPAIGDHKIVWELNRHQHWLALGRAHALTEDRRYYDGFAAQLSDWLRANPPLTGTNWASMLELAFRSLSWLWTVELFACAAGPGDREPWLVDLLLGLDRQLTHVERNLSRYFSPNTHLSGEALALYVAGLALPELRASTRRAAIGRQVLLEEAERQILADGGHAERSAHYHRYSTDFYLLAYAVAERAGDEAAPALASTARRQARYLRAITDDGGVRPAIGDDDGGQLFPICGRPPEDCRDTLATAAILLREPSLAIGHTPEEAYWMCGLEAAHASLLGGTRPPSAALPASGYVVSRTSRGDHLVFDAGPLGYLNGGHAHADALAFTLTIGGEPLLIDPGTATYTMSEELRMRFRSTPMHNALMLDGRSSSEPAGPFAWRRRTDAALSLWRAADGCEYAEGGYDGEAARHTRGILALHGVGWLVLDSVTGGGDARAETFWHVHPAWHCRLAAPATCVLRRGSTILGLGSTVPLALLRPGEHPLAHWSPAYGVVHPAPVLTGQVHASLPLGIGTFITASHATADALTVEEVAVEAAPGDGWIGMALRIGWRGGRLELLAALPGRPGPAEGAPARRWGSAALRTDARLALVLDRGLEARGERYEAVLLNGREIHDGAGQELIVLDERAPLVRTTVPSLAWTVHSSCAGPSRQAGT